MNPVTRFAPSPTGYLHVGSLRTALYNFMFAKQQGGTFLLRIEDTDQERLVVGADERLFAVLKRMGLKPDNKKIAYQSRRLKLYKKHAEQLLEQGSAYECFCTKERLEAMRQEQMASHQTPKYDRHCLRISAEEIKRLKDEKTSSVIRLKVLEGATTFEDIIRGRVTIQNVDMDDQVLFKSDGFPTYHLANVVDDHEMHVTHVIRGEEWLPSTPKHMMLYTAFGWTPPAFAHLPLLLNPDKSKLSKRQGDVAVEDFLSQGYLPEALMNFVALLGFNPTADREIFTLEELTRLFDLKKVNKSGAVFSREKLDWMNGHYLRQISGKKLLKLTKPFLADTKLTPAELEKIIEVEKARAHTLVELANKAGEYASLLAYAPDLLVWKKADAADAKTQLASMADHLETIPNAYFKHLARLEEKLKEYVSSHTLQNGNVFWPMRVALSGKTQSASPFELLWILGKKESVHRLKDAVKKLS